MKNSPQMVAKIQKFATLENAQTWQKLEDKFIFCQDLLECSVNNDEAVNALEDAFEKLLEAL